MGALKDSQKNRQRKSQPKGDMCNLYAISGTAALCHNTRVICVIVWALKLHRCSKCFVCVCSCLLTQVKRALFLFRD